MPLQRFLIAPFNSGIITYLKPWLTPDDSFQELRNAHVFRGRIKKRWGITYMENNESDLLSRLRIEIGTTNGSGNLGATVTPGPPGPPLVTANEGSQFSVGDTVFTIEDTGPMLSTGAATGTYDLVTGEVTITGADPDTAVYWYPALPVMGLTQYNDGNTVNFAPTIAFDQYFSYVYVSGAGGFQRLGPNSLWSGGQTNFVWNRMFANTNPDDEWLLAFNNKPFAIGVLAPDTTDGIKYRIDATPANDWTNFAPLLRYTGTPGSALRMTGGLCSIEFKGRLLVFAPWEGKDSTYAGDPTMDPITLEPSTQIINRVRYSWEFSLDAAANPQNLSDCFFEASGKGGYIDAPTAQNIVTVQFVKDRVVVYFESSTFELVYVGSPDAPFAWQKLDNTLGAESTFSQVPFDDAVVGIGSNGIHACNGANVVRIDEKIPDKVFLSVNEYLNNESALNSINGIRDYVKEMVYWTFPENNVDGDFPNTVLVYDYKNKNWASYDDTYTFFGYHDQIEGLIWATWHTPWESSNDPWNTPSTIKHQQRLIAGNQQGFVVMIDPDKSRLAPLLIILDLSGANTITSVNHNLKQGDFVQITGCTGSTNLNGVTVKVDQVVSPDIFTFITPDGSFADTGYTGGGLLERVSNVQLLTKQFNFFTNTGQQTNIPYIEFLVDTTPNFYDDEENALMGGRHTIDYFVGSSSISMLQASNDTATNAILGTNILETSPYLVVGGVKTVPNPQEVTQDRVWHRVYFQANNDVIQLKLYYTDEQMFNTQIPFTDFALHAMLIYADANSSRIAD